MLAITDEYFREAIMTHFDLSKLNLDLNRLVPTRADMDTLVGAFKEAVRSSAETRDLSRFPFFEHSFLNY